LRPTVSSTPRPRGRCPGTPASSGRRPRSGTRVVRNRPAPQSCLDPDPLAVGLVAPTGAQLGRQPRRHRRHPRPPSPPVVDPWRPRRPASWPRGTAPRPAARPPTFAPNYHDPPRLHRAAPPRRARSQKVPQSGDRIGSAIMVESRSLEAACADHWGQTSGSDPITRVVPGVRHKVIRLGASRHGHCSATPPDWSRAVSRPVTLDRERTTALGPGRGPRGSGISWCHTGSPGRLTLRWERHHSGGTTSNQFSDSTQMPARPDAVGRCR
jgi:hypothetical protein